MSCSCFICICLHVYVVTLHVSINVFGDSSWWRAIIHVLRVHIYMPEVLDDLRVDAHVSVGIHCGCVCV